MNRARGILWAVLAAAVQAGCGATPLARDGAPGPGTVAEGGPDRNLDAGRDEETSRRDSAGDASELGTDERDTAAAVPDAGDAGPGDTGDARVADGPPSTPAVFPFFVGGTRLHVNRIVGEDGSEAPVGLYDVQVGTACSFNGAEDGVIRCTPAAEDAEVRYLDSACSQAFAVHHPCTAPAGWTYDYGALGGRAFKLGAEVAPQTGQFWRSQLNGDGSSTCVQEAGFEGDYTFRSAEWFPASTFVAGKQQTVSDPRSRLSATYFVGEDGSQALISYRDTSLGQECSFQQAADGRWYCFPAGGSPQIFEGADCSTGLVASPAGDPAPGWVVIGMQALRLGPPYQGPRFWRVPVGGCLPSSFGDSSTYYPITNEDITAQVLLSGAPTPIDGPGRLKRLSFVAADGTVLEQPSTFGLLDTRFAERCTYQTATDGVRCLGMLVEAGNGPNLQEGWLDDTCMGTPVYGLFGRLPASMLREAVEVHWSVRASDPACNADVIDEVGLGQHVSQFFQSDSSGCEQISSAALDGSGLNLFTLGAAVPLTEFVAGTLSHD